MIETLQVVFAIAVILLLCWYTTIFLWALRLEFSFRRGSALYRLARKVLLVAWLDDAIDRYHDRKAQHEQKFWGK